MNDAFAFFAVTVFGVLIFAASLKARFIAIDCVPPTWAAS